MTWASPQNASQYAAPTLSGAKALQVPEKLSDLSGYAYAQVLINLGANDSAQTRSFRATSPWFSSFENQPSSASIKLGPDAERLKGETALVFLVFNPRGVEEGTLNRGPRLLAPVAALVSPGELPIEDRAIVEVKASIDTEGRVRNATVVGEHAEGVVDRALHTAERFVFAPGLREGQPVACEVTFPVLFTLFDDPVFAINRVGVPPKPKGTLARPVYPQSLRKAGITGEVLLQFEVDKSGITRNIRPLQATHAAFMDAAVDAVSQWRYTPGVKDGKPVRTRVQQAIRFSVSDRTTSEGYKVADKNLDKLPPEFRYDHPPKVKNGVKPVYPFTLLGQKAEGTALASFVISAEGRVQHIISCTSKYPEFEYAARAMLDEFRFDPASREGRPCLSALAMNVDFDLRSNSEINSVDRAILRELERGGQGFAAPDRLNEPLKLKSSRPPVFPTALLDRESGGEALLEVVIDEDGKVHLPRIVSASKIEFGYAAAQSVVHWRFEAPKVGPKEVRVLVRIPFKFVAKSETPPEHS